MRNWFSKILIVIACTQFVACNSYNKILKSTDLEFKFKMAKQYFDQKKYFKAEPIFDELLTSYKGTERQEDIYYYYSYCQFNLKNYSFASFHFKNFTTNFSYSKRLEEMEYMYAFCLYLESPNYSLDPNPTQKGLAALQLFVNKFPKSDKVQKCNELIDLLRDKLEKKSYETAFLFYKMEDFRAATIAFKSTLADFPDIDQREYIRYLIVKSSYNLAHNSVEAKKIDRYKDVLQTSTDFVNEFAESKYLPETQKLSDIAQLELTKLKNKETN